MSNFYSESLQAASILPVLDFIRRKIQQLF